MGKNLKEEKIVSGVLSVNIMDGEKKNMQKIIFNCKNCGSEFRTILSRIKIGKGKFCSRKCYCLDKRRRTNIMCQRCGIKFEIKNNRLSTAKYCSIKCYGKFGIDNPYYQKKHPEHVRIKMSASKQGITVKEWTKFNSKERSLLMGRPEYKEWRKSVFERDKYTCIWCGQVGGELNADHIKPWALYPKLRYTLDNGRTLCKPCHEKTPTYRNSFGRNQYVS